MTATSGLIDDSTNNKPDAELVEKVAEAIWNSSEDMERYCNMSDSWKDIARKQAIAAMQTIQTAPVSPVSGSECVQTLNTSAERVQKPSKEWIEGVCAKIRTLTDSPTNRWVWVEQVLEKIRNYKGPESEG